MYSSNLSTNWNLLIMYMIVCMVSRFDSICNSIRSKNEKIINNWSVYWHVFCNTRQSIIRSDSLCRSTYLFYIIILDQMHTKLLRFTCTGLWDNKAPSVYFRIHENTLYIINILFKINGNFYFRVGKEPFLFRFKLSVYMLHIAQRSNQNIW